ncbi:MAG: 2-oxo-hepta-3-ene-1,7-dioic acid hydratase, partial [Gammaproteobacteria bacterium]|nr:2-oxo-hepta-3-ene-1,7-dioic acid hydratase [Gammaproteobacteria bacterium]
MLNDSQIAEAARELHDAERERRQIRPVSLDFPDMEIADSYAIQDVWMAMKVAEGRTVRGRKIGLTSRVMQQAMHIDEPDYGTLLDDMFFEDGAEIEAAQFTDPRLEVELAFVLKRPLS